MCINLLNPRLKLGRRNGSLASGENGEREKENERERERERERGRNGIVNANRQGHQRCAVQKQKQHATPRRAVTLARNQHTHKPQKLNKKKVPHHEERPWKMRKQSEEVIVKISIWLRATVCRPTR